MIKTAKDYEDFVKIIDDRNRVQIRWLEFSEDIWFEILSRKPSLVGEVALNKNLPQSVLFHLASHSDENIRCTIAQKRKISTEIFELLSKDYSESVRSTVIYNPKVPEKILEKLSCDSNEFIANKAREKLNKIRNNFC